MRPYEVKVVKLTLIFFFLCVVLFVVGILKLMSFSPSDAYVQSRDYIVFEKNELWKNQDGTICSPNKICAQHLEVFRSGTVINLGAKMAINILNTNQMNKLIDTIQNTDIFNKDCVPQDKSYIANFVIKLGSQIKRVDYSGCKLEMAQIESQIL